MLAKMLAELNIDDLDSFIAYRAEALSSEFSITELSTLLKSLREYLYHLEILPRRLAEFKQRSIPIEALGLKIKLELGLKQVHVETVGQFLGHEKHLTWPETDLLAARIRLLVLLMVWAEQPEPSPIAPPENIPTLDSSPQLLETTSEYNVTITLEPIIIEPVAPPLPICSRWATYEEDEFGDDLFFLDKPWLNKTKSESWEDWGQVSTRYFENDLAEVKDFSQETNLSVLAQHVDIAIKSWYQEIIDHVPLSNEHAENIEEFDQAKLLWQRFNQQMRQTLGFVPKQIYEDALEDNLLKILETLQCPTHYLNITERFNELFSTDIDEKQMYNYLRLFANSFIALGEGIFSLVAWERQRKQRAEPILPFCGAILSPLMGKTDAFLESILVAHDYLQQQPKVAKFLTYMLQWAGLPTSMATWQKQSILNGYYLVGLIPYTFYLDDDNSVIYSNLPDLDLMALREYCLITLNRRLVKMPEFWWVLQTYQPGNATDFANHFVNLHVEGLNDVNNRLNLLTGLGATQRSLYGKQYQLTTLGLQLSRQWAIMPEFLPDESTDSEEEFSFSEMDLW